MNTHRFNGTKVNLDALSRQEVFNLNIYAHQHLSKALGEVATLNRFMKEHGLFRPLHEFGNPMTSFEHDPFIDDLLESSIASIPPKDIA